MRLLDQIAQTTRQAQAAGGPTFLAADHDPRWRPAPDSADGALRLDPEFSLPSAAGLLTWAVFYDSLTFVNNTWKETLAATGLEYGFPSGDLVSLSYRATPQGQRLTYSYNYGGSGALQSVAVQDPAARLVTLTCNSDGRVQTVEDW